RRLQRGPPALCPRLSSTGGLRRPPHRNGRPAPRNRTVAPVAHCSVGATAPNSSSDSGSGWMMLGGHSTQSADVSGAQVNRYEVDGAHISAAGSSGWWHSPTG